ncbi:conserved hypothetical protein [Pectobacterium parmentieri WPP163]|uniref:Uncharacterized protein n=1 Tax=Pectobacterium parmentieri TaxID=1905730 RepID=A0A0H3I4A0_PECPM|nr:conserved hypothetical protein [Pectobacterium parmentieri WPP163]AFI89498.1 Hypothetical protein W5S_1399 [Pectobacterium parmentieri]EJS95164.1 Hypothetical protein Y17_1374 [Pectobacterium wasabiae CFBP 3304]POW28435.1 hypothetical protein PB20LOC_01640 [Pectobacterium parmentieri]GKW10699.1 hypothetical protein PEC301899_09810 [Pectobacterium carotovorum subsp. carotovorum]
MTMFRKISKFFKRVGDVYVSYCERIGSIISPF